MDNEPADLNKIGTEIPQPFTDALIEKMKKGEEKPAPTVSLRTPEFGTALNRGFKVHKKYINEESIKVFLDMLGKVNSEKFYGGIKHKFIISSIWGQPEADEKVTVFVEVRYLLAPFIATFVEPHTGKQWQRQMFETFDFNLIEQYTLKPEEYWIQKEE